nr:MAG TPA: hypothetical protein [Caudoviricetes sp.]
MLYRFFPDFELHYSLHWQAQHPVHTYCQRLLEMMQIFQLLQKYLLYQ